MAPLTTIESAVAEKLQDRDGRSLAESLLPALSDTEIAGLETRWKRPLPRPIKELLAVYSGFVFAPMGLVRFQGMEDCALPEIFPLSRALAKDDEGNQWIIDIRVDAEDWGPVFFVCHDPPVVVLQANDLSELLEQIFGSARAGQPNLIDIVSQKLALEVWKTGSVGIPIQDAKIFADEELRFFANELPDDWAIIDLRARRVGSGFAWGRGGPTTPLARMGSELIFAVGPSRKPTFFRRLLTRIAPGHAWGYSREIR
ncbi:MAG: SMI1/KNR4 family protein [Thermoanaerobaculia bacterium]|nr:SMI1/KNR4 family protein [Thermoanaerobaculia bacterium]